MIKFLFRPLCGLPERGQGERSNARVSTRHALQPMLTHWFRNFNAFVLALAAGRYIFFFELLNLPA
jgi:hypothetical protein